MSVQSSHEDMDTFMQLKDVSCYSHVYVIYEPSLNTTCLFYVLHFLDRQQRYSIVAGVAERR